MDTSLFRTQRGAAVPLADTKNAAGGAAYSLGAEAALAQYAATGTFGSTFYVDAKDQLTEVLTLCAELPSDYIAKCAVYARQRGYLKDMPAFLLAVIAARGMDARNESRSGQAFRAAFPRVIDNGKMLRNFVQVVRSGVTGRKSFGTGVRGLIRSWLERRTPEQLFRDQLGEKPSLADVIKMVHPKPFTPARGQLYRYLIGKADMANVEHISELPDLVLHYEAFKSWASVGRPVDSRISASSREVPDIDFRLLDSLQLTDAEWKQVAARAPWHMTRMNLNTFARHGVLKDPAMVTLIADRLRDPEQVRRARAYPYQLLAAFTNASDDVPMELKLALQHAMEIAVSNVPALPGGVVVCPDVSGSMQDPVTGTREGQTPSKVRCIDVAALIAAAVLRKSPRAALIPFANYVPNLQVNPLDSVMTLAAQIASVGGGGTACSIPLQALNGEPFPVSSGWGSRQMARLNSGPSEVSTVIFISDNESWADRAYGGGSPMMEQWQKLKVKHPKAKLVCIDLTPAANAQATNAPDRLNIGGFSDAVFDVIASFLEGGSATHWVDAIKAIDLTADRG